MAPINVESGSSVDWAPDCKWCGPGALKLGLLAKSCNTAAGGQEYLDVDGDPASYPYSKIGSEQN